MMLMASNGHFLGQIPHPIHSRSEMKAILLVPSTSMQSFPVRTTGQDFLHSCRHFLGLHLSELTMAILRLMLVFARGICGNVRFLRTESTCPTSLRCAVGQFRYSVGLPKSSEEEVEERGLQEPDRCVALSSKATRVHLFLGLLKMTEQVKSVV